MFGMQTNLIVTKKARERIINWSKDEHAFFSIQKLFEVHIEKRPVNAQGETAIIVYFDNESNKVLASKIEDRIVIMDCIVKYDGLLMTNIRAVHGKFPLKTNRRFTTKLHFVTKPNNTVGMPIELHTKIRELPVAEERSEYVKKRISSWEGYLKIQERDANIEDMTASYSHIDVNDDFSRMTLVCNGLKNDDWKKLRGLSVSLKGFKDNIGDVLKANAAKNTVEIELRGNIKEMFRRNQFRPKTKEVVFSNFATLSQVRRLRKGFADLEKGLAANGNLEKILFDDRPRIRAPKERQELEFHNPLNEFQREAVIGAMTAEDLYVIQGPPGTGKTTVISEICLQNAKAGLRTLVASQSNLAVDNALSRLLSNKDIRILRFGRTESIEEEGKKFIEENVGIYWLEQTLSAIKQEISAHSSQEKQLNEELIACEENSHKLHEEKNNLIEKIEAKMKAQVEQEELLAKIKVLKKTLGSLKREREQLEEDLKTAQKAYDDWQEDIVKIEKLFEENPPLETLQENLQQVRNSIVETTKQLNYRQAEEELAKVENSLQVLHQEYAETQQHESQLQQKIAHLAEFKKIGQITSFMEQHHIQAGYVINGQLAVLDKLHKEIVSQHQWVEVNDRLNSTIGYIEKLLGNKAAIIVNKVNSAPTQHAVYSVQEIHQVIDQVKQYLQANKQSPDPIRMGVFLEGLYRRRQFVWQQGTTYQQTKQEIFRLFSMLKAEVAEQMKVVLTASPAEEQQLKNKGMQLKATHQQLQQKYNELKAQIDDVSTIDSLQQLQGNLRIQQTEVESIEKSSETLQRAQERLVGIKAQMYSESETIATKTVMIQEIDPQIKQVNAEGLQQETQLKVIEEILQQNPEQQLEKVELELVESSVRIVKIKRELIQLPVKQALQQEWYTLLEDANEHDLDEIRKLYVRHANVIGTTCVASARKEFMDNYPTFDVVIIDEVSKATPPELLLPMLKGKKIILVGDHHQLPPLVGEDTLEETLKAILEENNELEGKAELKKLLKESLFERLFKNLPRSNKQMLAIQYRMHEKIMQTIAPFYENEDNRLQCGLTDSDKMRDHLLECHYVKRDDHLIWLNIPNDKPFFEEQMKDGKSRFNQVELDVIRDVLIDIDHATEMAKNAGLIPVNEKKSIGVISFYGEQVKKIDRLLQQQLNLKHLHLRTGTVDKFQGMEMDVILVSMVRNNNHKNADIGFASDYRRLNVALSRARELLMLIGSTEMFTERAKQLEARAMYSRLLETVKAQNGLRDVEGVTVK